VPRVSACIPCRKVCVSGGVLQFKWRDGRWVGERQMMLSTSGASGQYAGNYTPCVMI
jgi:hypothetical protein